MNSFDPIPLYPPNLGGVGLDYLIGKKNENPNVLQWAADLIHTFIGAPFHVPNHLWPAYKDTFTNAALDFNKTNKT